ncbi:laccase [Aspergillus heteromorphus CBS 117.55]|uniref:Laccase n=1 Tax=Aspergillus heteromorphus CBS 117.55 TaxID=1448321 RepID=A0A317WVX7_9EURO|nr:laccase [Aspergillus heteromorphus CBS 117.55]PWY90011.1 laccase [Aspergillus heteromorphus CBS 117.55]
MDGAVGVTQQPILPGTTFTYNFTIPMDQSGTFWYHAHAGLSRADGLYGGLIVHAPAPKSTVRGLMARADDYKQDGYTKDLLLLVGDWYHRPADQIYAWYMRAGSFGNEPVPDSLLVNGRGQFDCSMAAPARPVDCTGQKMDLSFLDTQHSTSRIRIVNTGSLAGFTLEFQDRDFKLVQVDSVDVVPQDSNSAGILYPGQRMDILLRPSNREQADSMTIHLDKECFRYPNPVLTSVQTFPISSNPNSNPLDHSYSSSSPYTSISLSEVATAPSLLSALPDKAEQTHVVYTKIEKLSRNHNIPYGFFNRTSWKPQTGNPLIQLPQEQWDENQLVMSTGPSISPPGPDNATWVDLVVNNLDDNGHPFHLHGHHFYILNVYQPPIGWGAYNPFTDAYPPGLPPPRTSTASSSTEPDTDTDTNIPNTPYDLTRAQLRDTVHIPRRGYAVLRFRADNPGVWLFHCHILWHSASGMAMLVHVK